MKTKGVYGQKTCRQKWKLGAVFPAFFFLLLLLVLRSRVWSWLPTNPFLSHTCQTRHSRIPNISFNQQVCFSGYSKHLCTPISGSFVPFATKTFVSPFGHAASWLVKHPPSDGLMTISRWGGVSNVRKKKKTRHFTFLQRLQFTSEYRCSYFKNAKWPMT